MSKESSKSPHKDPAPLLKTESKKRLDTGDEKRRNRFKERSKNLERGISAPIFAQDLPSQGAKSKGPLAPLPLTAEEAVTVGQGLGHEFIKKTYFQPTYCHHCTDLLWGIRGQGLQCAVCNFVTHERCISALKVPCTHLMAAKIQHPVAHKWTKPHNVKKAFCNVCRRKICSMGVICEVCKYYAHNACKENAFNNCKECATYTKGAKVNDKHHWIEGNLPSSARCQNCSKSCSSSESLSGFRCGWCGICVHSGCLDAWQQKQLSCTFRQLRGMIVAPKCVTHHHAISSDLDPESPGEEWTELGVDSDEPDSEGKTDDDSKTKPCVVVDGRDKSGFKKWRKNTMHPTPITKATTAAQLLSISLRKFGISEDPSEYYLVEVIDSSRGEERELDPGEFPYNVKPTSYGVIRLHIRHKSSKEKAEETKGKIHVFNSHLESSIDHVVVFGNIKMTAAEIVEESLIKFDLVGETPAEYCLVEVSQVNGVRERVLDDKECPIADLRVLRRASVTFSNRQRYFVRHRTGYQTTLCITHLSKDILKDEATYTKHVKDLIAEAPAHLVPESIPYDEITIGPAFPSMGTLVLDFPTYDLAMRISVCLEQSSSRPKVIMLPTIYSEIIGVDQEPLLVFINAKSGGNQGVELLSAFRRHLNPHQVFDLSQGGPIPGLYAFKDVERFRILIGGGDGTFGWVLGGLTAARDILKCKEPPCALLPLGTGNDLARALNWGGGYSGEKVMQILLNLEDANVVKLDRWEVNFNEVQLPKEAHGDVSGMESVVMNNYVGVGLDAAIALDFHLAREENPEKFNSRFHNKGVYLQLGLQKMISKGDTKDLHRHINVFADGKRVDLPDVEGLVFLNIQSWGAGADAWGTSQDPNFEPAASDDGKLELVGISGVIQMGQIQSGVRCGIRIAQASEFKVDILSLIPVQVDGEAWPQPPSVMTLKALPEQATMLRGPDKGAATFSRSLSRKEEEKKIALLHTVSQPEILLSGGLSSRRGRTSATTPPTVKETEEGWTVVND